MKKQEAIKKYGKETFEKMGEYMDGITISVDEDGDIDIPDRDLELAYKQLKGYKLNPEEWD